MLLKCTKAHVNECPDDEQGRKCPRGKKCPFMHRRRKKKSQKLLEEEETEQMDVVEEKEEEVTDFGDSFISFAKTSTSEVNRVQEPVSNTSGIEYLNLKHFE